MAIITILVFILILSILVLIHEAGHFFVAKKFGVKVEEFGFGFPPRVYGKKIGETIYSINLLPIGGFVRLYGEDDAGSGKIAAVKDYTKLKDKDLQRAFFVRPVWQRALIVLAGVIMNFVLALVVISYVYTFVGLPQPTDTVMITEVIKHSPADIAGIKRNDVIVSINNTKITQESQVPEITSKHPNQQMTVTILRQQTTMNVLVTPKYNPQEKKTLIGIGIAQKIVTQKYPWYQAPFFGLKELANETWQILVGLGSTAKQVSTQGTVPQGLAGPVGIEQLVGIVIQNGFISTLMLVSLLSLNLAVLNVLPIPALDGGRLFFILFEGVTGRKVNQKFEGYVHMVGMIVLLTLIALLTYHDILRMVHGESLLPQ
ncbi:MAG TPA: M50 family metallopeptidase [Candidatus Saccharimonadales bacterium]|nr:M50 family metallopeptidase [Candidatus Saccharimonadales bacterium]